MKNFIVYVVITSIVGMILYPIFDLLLCNFITNSHFSYSVYNHIIEPILFSIVISSVLYISNKKSK